jgi:hypothetical protein
MGTPSPTSGEGRKLGFERFIFFSDAVFAIAITLLVLDLRVPNADAFALAPLIPKLLGFGISFYVIGRYWLAHHRLFEAVEGYDGLLLGANLWFLASIAFLPFPTSVVTEARPNAAPVTFYAASMMVVGLAMFVLVLIARRPALLRPGQTRGGHGPRRGRVDRRAAGVRGDRRGGRARLSPGVVAVPAAVPGELGGRADWAGSGASDRRGEPAGGGAMTDAVSRLGVSTRRCAERGTRLTKAAG